MLIAAADVIKEMNEIGIYNGIVFILLAGALIIILFEGVGKLKKILGLTTKDELYRQELDERLNRHSDKIIRLEKKLHDVDTKIDELADSLYSKQKKYHEQSIEVRSQLKNDQNDIKNSLLDLKSLVIKQTISDMRWEILDFANAVMSGREYNKEQFDHVLEIYDEYEKILKENNMDNGKVDRSMDFVNKQYAYFLENGFKR